LISVLLTTYNWPEALSLCLQSLQKQTDKNFEIILCDDGSTKETQELIEEFQKNFPVKITHLWQEDNGFRKTLILNKGIQASSGSYLVFLDGDCITQSDFIEQHRRLAEQNHLVTGSRILCGPKLTQELCKSLKWDPTMIHHYSFSWRLNHQINKLLPLFLKLPNHRLRNYSKFVWSRIKGCNMACWKSDALKISGFDESLTGWGHEDADFVFRLQDSGVKRKSGSWATEVIHLWHKTMSKENATKNAAIVREKIMAKAKKKH
jgi:glycosyltransferase involved in cell wall biosynthesis